MKIAKKVITIYNLNLNVWYLLFFFQLFFILTRFIYYKNPLIESDYGNHLLISKYIAQGRIPYKEFSLTHMPGLYIPMSLGFLISDSIFLPFLFYVLITSIAIPLFCVFSAQFFRKKKLLIIGLLVFLTDPLLTLYSKAATFDCFNLPFVIAILILLMQKKKLKIKDYLLLSILFVVIFFIKIPSVYFLGFFILSGLLFYSGPNLSDKLKNKKIFFLRAFVVFILIIGIFSFSIFILRPEVFQDIFSSHLSRSRMKIEMRLKNLTTVFLYSPIAIFLGFVSGFWNIFFSKSKKLKHFSFFFLFFFLFSLFVPSSFWPQHIILLMPIGIILFLKIIEEIFFFTKNKLNRNFKLKLIILSIIFMFQFVFWLNSLFSSELGNNRIYDKVSKLDGFLYTANNYHYIATGKEPYFWYFATIPDGPCKWTNLCGIHKKFLEVSDFVLLDQVTDRNITDKGFYEYLSKNFYLEDHNLEGDLRLYMRR